jgi:hypothetical protein
MAAITPADFGDVADDYVSDEYELVIWGGGGGGPFSRESAVTRSDETYSSINFNFVLPCIIV